MKFSLSSSGIRAVILDIEGTTTPVSFVYDVLFPYAKHEMYRFLKAHVQDNDIQEIIRALKAEHEEDVRNNLDPPLWLPRAANLVHSASAYAHWLIERDRKSTPLKDLQGRIWREGYEQNKLRSEMFDDVPAALEQWRNAGVEIRIYSSGSELAQRLLFSHAACGDLTPFIGGYFDTRTGSKSEEESYVRIAKACGLPPAQMLFVSDLTRELDAARAAGMKTLLCRRPGNQPQLLNGHATISSFADIS